METRVTIAERNDGLVDYESLRSGQTFVFDNTAFMKTDEKRENGEAILSARLEDGILTSEFYDSLRVRPTYCDITITPQGQGLTENS